MDDDKKEETNVKSTPKSKKMSFAEKARLAEKKAA
jgi:hypothetical protein